MRRLTTLAFTLTLLLATSNVCRADEAGKIIDQCLKAAGGSKTVSHVQTLALDGNYGVAGESKSGTYTFRAKQPNRYYTELQSEGKTLIEAYNGKSA